MDLQASFTVGPIRIVAYPERVIILVPVEVVEPLKAAFRNDRHAVTEGDKLYLTDNEFDLAVPTVEVVIADIAR